MKKIVVFGAGIRGKRYVSNPYIKSDVIAFVDNNENLWGTYYQGIPILSPSQLKDLQYDYIVISIIDTKIYNNIKNQLISSLSVPDNKIVSYSECPEVLVWGFNDIGKAILTFFDLGSKVGAYIENDSSLWGQKYCGVPIICPKDIMEFANFGSIVIATADDEYENIEEQLISMGINKNKIQYCSNFIEKHISSARFIWMRNYAKWINEQNLKGSVAECGVCTGDSAKFLNEYFPNRKLYLFDTFDGFAEQDIIAELNLKNQSFNESCFSKTGFFAQTSVDIVFDKMNYPENVIIKKGYFPDSANDVDDKFCFVNLDMDLYQPMLAGLHFFWDKVVEGGCIVLHDYFHPNLPGVAQAVADFEKQKNIRLYKTVLGDECSIVILK